MEIAALSRDARSEAVTTPEGRNDAVVGRLLAFDAAAYRLAVNVLGTSDGAEDAVQQAYLEVIAYLRSGRPPEDERAWFLRAVANTARNVQRGEARRRQREATMAGETRKESKAEPAGGELIPALRRALAELEEDERLPLALCYQEGLSQREAALVLEVPERTLSRRVGEGLDRLRERLAKSGYAVASGAIAGALAGTAPPVPAGLTASISALISNPGAMPAGASAAAIKGGLLMKIGLGLAALGLAAGGVLWAAGGRAADGTPAAAAAPVAPAPGAPKSGHKDFEYTTLGKTAFIEHVAFLGAIDDLDGPGREAMQRGIFCVTGDVAGNMYFYETGSNCIRALRKRDGRMFTLSGTRYISSGRPGQGGAADSLKLYHECFITMPSLAAVGDPLDGDGSLYVADDSGAVVRLWRKAGVWQYELAAGLGKGKPADGAVATEIGFTRSALVATGKGEIGLIAGNAKSCALYWLRGGKLVAAYDHAFVEKELGKPFYCRGIDVKGNFVGASGGEYNAAESCIAVVSPDGKTVKKVATPYAPQWTICPDAKRERWFFRACDDYAIQYTSPEGKALRLLRDGSWKPLAAGSGNKGRDEVLNWSRGITLPDGRYAGWNGHDCSPVFTITWLEDGK